MRFLLAIGVMTARHRMFPCSTLTVARQYSAPIIALLTRPIGSETDMIIIKYGRCGLSSPAATRIQERNAALSKAPKEYRNACKENVSILFFIVLDIT